MPDPTVIAFLDKTRLSQIITNGLRYCAGFVHMPVCVCLRVFGWRDLLALFFPLGLQQCWEVHDVRVRSSDSVAGGCKVPTQVDSAPTKHAVGIPRCD
jgi:hypothetical protein